VPAGSCVVLHVRMRQGINGCPMLANAGTHSMLLSSRHLVSWLQSFTGLCKNSNQQVSTHGSQQRRSSRENARPVTLTPSKNAPTFPLAAHTYSQSNHNKDAPTVATVNHGISNKLLNQALPPQPP